jgi:hypothetical protein
MSIHLSTLNFLLAINKKKKINGKFLSIGKQTVYIPVSKVFKTLKKYNFKIDDFKKDNFKIDSNTRNKNDLNMEDESLINTFAKTDYKSLDKSFYENANEIFDLNASKLPKKLINSYDFIYDGGTLDNIFSPANAIVSFSKMLKKNGRILHSNMSSGWPGAYCTFSCEWFYSFYSINNFKNVQVFLLVPKSGKWPNPSYYVYLFNPYFKRKKNYDPFIATKNLNISGSTVICYAEKNSFSTSSKLPIQSHYIEKKDLDWRKKNKIFKMSKLKYLKLDKTAFNKRPYLSDHYSLLGVLK